MGQILLPGELAMRSRTDLDVQRGRDAAKRIADTVRNYAERGIPVAEVRVSQRVADAMIAYFASWCRFDGVLPPRVHGVPFYVGDTGGEDVTFKLPQGARAGRH